MGRGLLSSALIVLSITLTAGPASAQPTQRRVWLRVFASSRHREARQVRRLLAPESIDGGRLRQVFLRRSRSGQGATLHEVLTGPFAGAVSAVLHGLELRRDPRFVKAGLRLRSLAVLLPTSFLPLPIHLDKKSLERLNPGRKKPYPRLGTLLTARVYGFSLPTHALPPIERATAKFTPWNPLLVLGEQTTCDASKKHCLRWFEVLHPMRIRTAFVPAYCLVLHRQVKRYTVPAGKTTERVKGALWSIGRSPTGRLFRVMFRRGTLPPQLHTLTLNDRNKPPYRLVVDRHGPGLYNSEGKVVQRIKLRAWIYVRPHLWQQPKELVPTRRRAPPRRTTAPPARRTSSRRPGPRPARRQRPAMVP